MCNVYLIKSLRDQSPSKFCLLGGKIPGGKEFPLPLLFPLLPLFPGDQLRNLPSVFPSPAQFSGIGCSPALLPALHGSGLWNERHKTELLRVTHICWSSYSLFLCQLAILPPQTQLLSIFLKMPDGIYLFLNRCEF